MQWILVVYTLTYSTPEPTGFRVPTDFPTRAACEFWGAKVPQHGDAVVLDGSGNLIVVPPISFRVPDGPPSLNLLISTNSTGARRAQPVSRVSIESHDS